MKAMKQIFVLAMALVWGIAVQAQVDPVNKDGVAIGGMMWSPISLARPSRATKPMPPSTMG